MSLQSINAQKAKELIKEGATLIDIREADEYAREHILGSKHHPLSQLSHNPPKGSEVIIYHCRSGGRTKGNAPTLAAAATCEAYILEGGIEGWKQAGLPVKKDEKQPIEIMRQVQIAAGSLVVLGVILGAAMNPGFYALSGFVGAGLVFAGVTGTCGMAKILSFMPWNRRPA